MEQYYTVDQISQILNIHPKTIQRYIREGKLRASKIGKSWRVTGHDLSLFAEDTVSDLAHSSPVIPKEMRIQSSSVIDIHVSDKDEAYRIITALNAAMNAKPAEYGNASLATQFVEQERLVRLMLWGNLAFMESSFSMVRQFTEQGEE